MMSDIYVCRFCSWRNPAEATVCEVCGLPRSGVPTLLYFQSEFDPSLMVSREIAVGNEGFDITHRGGESLLYLTESRLQTLEKAGYLGSAIGKTIVLRPSPLPYKEVRAAGG